MAHLTRVVVGVEQLTALLQAQLILAPVAEVRQLVIQVELVVERLKLIAVAL
jgi:hypothetical protein